MVINKDMKRKRKEEPTNDFLDESPKRTKVHAQRKFAQGSNMSSPAILPVITPIKDLEKQDKLKADVLPEPQELMPIHRPPTEDFLTFLCFRGTAMLPSSLNFFSNSPVVSPSKNHSPPLKVEAQKPSAPINDELKPQSSHNGKPFIAFGVRKRADPILISKQMDKKRRHALALQALRRKYQEQKMAKIRAVTISKLSERVTSKTIITRTRSVIKPEPTAKKLTVTTPPNPIKTPLKPHIQKKMCLRSFRGRFTHHELQVKVRKRKPVTIIKKIRSIETESKEESSSEFSSDDDEPLVNTIKSNSIKVAKKSAPGPKKPSELGFRVTRANVPFPNTRSQPAKRRLPTLRTHATRSHFVKMSKTLHVNQPFRHKVIRKNLKPPNKIDAQSCSSKSAKGNVLIKREKSEETKSGRENCNTRASLAGSVKNLSDNQSDKKSSTEAKQNCKNVSSKSSSNCTKVGSEDKRKNLPVKDNKNVKQNEAESKSGIKENNDIKKTELKEENAKKVESKKTTSPMSKESESTKKDVKKQAKSAVKSPLTKETNDGEKGDYISRIRKCSTKTDGAKVPQRPSRKTKEAAAIYMEILGHKLVNESDIDDDNVSIDSFPELPNVRKTEQRENELKAKAKSRAKDEGKRSKIEITESDNKSKAKAKISEENVVKSEIKTRQSNTVQADKNDRMRLGEKEKPQNEIELKDHIQLPSKNQEKSKVTLQCKTDSFVSIKKLSEISITAQKLEDTSKTGKVVKEDIKIKNEFSASVSLQKLPCDNLLSKQFCNRTQTSIQTETIDTNKRSTRSSKIYTMACDWSDFDESEEEKSSKGKRKAKGAQDSDSEQSTTSEIVKTSPLKNTESQKVKTQSSSTDSDEEPLSKLIQMKAKDNVGKCDKKAVFMPKSSQRKDSSGDLLKQSLVSKNLKTDNEAQLISTTKPKRECTKRPQNYRSLFSSSDDEDKYFHGFIKFEPIKNKPKVKREKSPIATQSADLLCKDVDKRFGKGKVNMSNEQIEKWLTDSANSIKNEAQVQEKLDFDLTRDLPFSTPHLLSPIKSTFQPDIKTEIKPIRPDKFSPPLKKPSLGKKDTLASSAKPTERKTIFRKEKNELKPNVNAFSPVNESSVYAFEAENDDIIKTPFRHPIRRPSSTTTSKSEESFKHDAKRKGTFQVPQLLKPDTVKNSSKQVSIMLTTEESSSASIAVQLNLGSPEMQNSVQTDGESGEQVFYIPLQPGKQNASQVIQGVAVKLGTKGTSGPNQRVVMSAKLVTHPPIALTTENPPVHSIMEPPSIIQRSRNEARAAAKCGNHSKSSDRASESSEDFKYKIPHSPSPSSSSSANNVKKLNVKTKIRSLDACNPIVLNDFPPVGSAASILEAPVFRPNDKDFQDPLDYIEKIRPQAEKFGICRIVPPAHFKPECKVADDMRFTAYNQYVHKMLNRWGPNFKELMAISKYLKTQNITLTRPPWIGGMEIDLPKLYQIVQSLGGLKDVIEKKKWCKVSELMKIPKSAQDRVTKLDDIYCKYLLPYDTLSPAEREKLFDEVETEWAKRESRSLLRSQQNVSNEEESSNSSESDSDDEYEECIVKGRSMALNAFYRIARNTMSMWFKTMEPSAEEVEQEFWKNVIHKQNHICVHSGSIDSGNWGYGFAVSKNSPFARHAWNLKVLTNNSGSVLRSMGPKMGVTVPTLHVGMVFSACCWYRDPHSLPWIEYLHTGRNKIWYSIPDSNSELFHSALLKLVPNYCRNKSLWLPSDTAMVPPNLLTEHGVSLCRTIQEPGQFIVVFPKAFTSSLCTGYVVSESVYFAPPRWLEGSLKAFDELRNSCEPSMFSLEKLILKIAADPRSSVDVLKAIIPIVENLCNREIILRGNLKKLGVSKSEKLPLPEVSVKKKKQQSENGDYECDVCCKNLFISWVTESQEGIYCLEHAVEYLQKKKCEATNCKLVYSYEQKELGDLQEKIKVTIENKMQKKQPGKITH